MGHVGFLLYGYGESEATRIKGAVDGILSTDSIMLSASGREDDTIDDVLRDGPSPRYKEKEHGFMMLLGMDEEAVMKVVSEFPKEGVPRPIFCTLTESNIGWKVGYLLEHLLEEQRAWARETGNR